MCPIKLNHHTGKTNILEAMNLIDDKVEIKESDLRQHLPYEEPIDLAYVNFVFEFNELERKNLIEEVKKIIILNDDKRKIIKNSKNELKEGINITANLIKELKKYVKGVHIMAIGIEENIPEIIKNIYNYSENLEYNQALLLLGSGHRKTFFEKIKKYEPENNVKLNWALYGN